MIPKFRAWDVLAEKMIDEILMISFVRKEIIGKFSKGSTSVPLKFEDERNGEDVILMQSTDMVDKNGKEIFEGDVVGMRNPRDRRQIGMFQVVRVANSPMLGLLCKKLTTEIFNLYEHMRNYYEVKGNIYENPELLEDK